MGLMPLRKRLGQLQCRDALLIAPEKPHAGRDPDPCPALSEAVPSGERNLAEGLHSLLDAAKLAQNAGAQKPEAHTIFRGGREPVSALSQFESAFVAQ